MLLRSFSFQWHVKEMNLLLSLTCFSGIYMKASGNEETTKKEIEEPRVADSKKERRTLKLLFFS